MTSINAENAILELRFLPITTNLYWDFLHNKINKETDTEMLIALLVEGNRVISELNYYLSKDTKSKVYFSKKQPSEDRPNINLSLRYFILKRDNYHCLICGRGAEDQVKLHVDHIKPFSKGGKTREDNLRTLCFDCNMGKKDHYEPTS